MKGFYLPHHEDIHGRFMTSESIAFQKGFHDQPVVDQWAQMLKRKIMEHYPEYEMPRQNYFFEQTVDIDAAWPISTRVSTAAPWVSHATSLHVATSLK